MKKLWKTLLSFVGALVIFWVSALVIFAENYGAGNGGLMIHTATAVDPYMAITAAGIVGFAGVAVFVKRNVLNKR